MGSGGAGGGGPGCGQAKTGDAEAEIKISTEVNGAPRPMKMGTTRSPWRYDVVLDPSRL
jgi:hypothetical protein